MSLEVETQFDTATSTLTYLVYDSESRDAVVIDPVWDYDPNSSTLSTGCFEKLRAAIKDRKLKLHRILETHAHADHLSSSQLLKKEFPTARLGIGRKIIDVQHTFKGIYNWGDEFKADGSQFDDLFSDGQTITAGTLSIQILTTPGHTPACVSYLIGSFLFTGDALFMPDGGTGRCDFPGGSAETLYTSIHGKIYRLGDSIQTFTGHDYQPNGRRLEFRSTIGEHKNSNIHLKEATSAMDFIEFRKNRDRGLPAPRLLLPSLQINLRGGRLPPPESNQRSYLKIPVSGY